MGPLAMMGILAAAGLLKSKIVDEPKEKRDRMLAAATQRYSPWTGLQAGPIQEADPFGSALQGGMSGAMLGQNMQDNELQGKLTNSMIEKNKAVTNSLGGPGPSASPNDLQKGSIFENESYRGQGGLYSNARPRNNLWYSV